MTLPQYDGGSIVNLMSTIAAGFGSPAGDYIPLTAWDAGRFAGHAHVVLLVIDGLGYHYLKQAARGCSLADYPALSLTSVFPSTTATAVTAFLTGHPAQQHGLTGWHMFLEAIGETAAILPFQTRAAGLPLPSLGMKADRIFCYPTFCERISADCFAVSPEAIAFSDFNRAHTRGATTVPYRSLNQFFENIERCTRSDSRRRFIYAYYPEFDSTAHERGVASPLTLSVLKRLSEGIERLLRSLAGRDVTVIITADHGFVDGPPAKLIEVESHPPLAECLAHPLCGERRLAYCYVKPEKHAQFENYVKSELSEACDLYPSPALISAGWFGLGAPHPELTSRVGDYTLVMREGYTIKDWLPGEKRHTLIGVHGGLTEDEMLVPLIVARP